MSSKKEEKGQVAAERIKAAALSAAKGLSRAQAERAAAAAARNVNAYGQKEEGPSRWQERKEAKRQMYLMSTEKAVKLGVRKDLKSSSTSASGGVASQCQKCFQPGHWTYECKNERVYISRPSRSQMLKNPTRRPFVVSFEGNPDVTNGAVNVEVQNGGDKKRKNIKRKHRSRKDYESDTSEASVFDSDSDSSESESEYSSSESSSSDYSSSDSEERRGRRRRRRRRRRKQRKQLKRRPRMSSSSSYSETESDSESNSDSGSDSDSSGRDSRRRSRRRSRRC